MIELELKSEEEVSQALQKETAQLKEESKEQEALEIVPDAENLQKPPSILLKSISSCLRMNGKLNQLSRQMHALVSD